MNQKKLSKWLKGMIIGIAICGTFIFGVVLPYIGRDVAAEAPDFAGCFWPWMIFLWVAAVPCYLVLALGWNIASEIGRDCSFTKKNAEFLKYIMILTIADTGLFFVVNIIYLFLNMSHPSVVIASLFICFAGVCIALVAGTLSHLVQKAAVMREENESFI